ncbi:MAG: 4Fe-4S binding protein [Caldilineales bacterium]|nr:4Fe-4S binding protein [Caldilineales bacterium]
MTPTIRPDSSWRFDLTRIPWIYRALRWRPLQFSLVLIMLAFFVLAILTSFFGTPAGNRNFAIIFVWIVWWALVIILMVPALGRGWCAICPIPAPGEWMQRQSFVHPRRRTLWTLGKRWPKKLKNIWLQNFSFLTVALFSAIILTRPSATGIVLLAFILVAMGLSLVYERRTFCRYVCPVGGFIGLYSMAAPIELRVKDIDVCRTHDSKDCYLGNEHGFGCPWMVFPGSLQRNTHCGLCTECMKTCTMDNVAVNLRLPGLDFFVAKQRRMDEAYKAFIMLTCALAYSVVLLGPWGLLKDAANFVRIDWWLLYAAGFLALNLLIVPGIFFLAAAASRKLGDFPKISARTHFIDLSYSLIPLGLAAWIAFSLGFVLVNISYALPVIADPFGWGWNLFGLRDVAWTPILPDLVPYLQVPVLLGGLAFALYTLWRILGERTQARLTTAALPPALFLTLATFGFLWLYLG